MSDANMPKIRGHENVKSVYEARRTVQKKPGQLMEHYYEVERMDQLLEVQQAEASWLCYWGCCGVGLGSLENPLCGSRSKVCCLESHQQFHECGGERGICNVSQNMQLCGGTEDTPITFVCTRAFRCLWCQRIDSCDPHIFEDGKGCCTSDWKCCCLVVQDCGLPCCQKGMPRCMCCCKELCPAKMEEPAQQGMGDPAILTRGQVPVEWPGQEDKPQRM
jgi:hypothetical protein